MQKQVKIVGISINEQFGSLKATSLKFNEENRLTVIKGEVGAGKTTLQRSLKLGTQGSQTLEDKNLYGDKIDIVTQLLDGETSVFVGCKSKGDGLEYFIYSQDKDGKKIKDVVIDGQKLTPAGYLKSLQTALTWNLNELTSENPTVQRDILLKTYAAELEKKGVIFNKNHEKYVGSIIDKIEKAKNDRNYADMKRKETGGIADDMGKKGIDFQSRRTVKDTKELENEIASITASITLAKTNLQESRDNSLTKIKNNGLEALHKLKSVNEKIQTDNREENKKKTTYERQLDIYDTAIKKAKEYLFPLIPHTNDEKDNEAEFYQAFDDFVEKNTVKPKEPEIKLKKELVFNEKGTCLSKAEDFENEEIKELLTLYNQVAIDYTKLVNQPLEKVDTSEKELQKEKLEQKLERFKEYNREAVAINSFHDWKDKNEEVKSIQKDYFLKLTEINTGVEGLYICPEYEVDKDGAKIAKGNDIYLMYDGSYDIEYFNNPNKELRKLAAYSDTQKPMVCLLIQKYLLSQKEKALPYLWIDQVPIDNKTKALLDRMSQELGLWLFVNWTGDFDKSLLKDGEILIENGEIFEKEDQIDEVNNERPF